MRSYTVLSVALGVSATFYRTRKIIRISIDRIPSHTLARGKARQVVSLHFALLGKKGGPLLKSTGNSGLCTPFSGLLVPGTAEGGHESEVRDTTLPLASPKTKTSNQTGTAAG